MPLSSSATLPSLLSLAKKIHKLEGSHVKKKKFSLSGKCCLCDYSLDTLTDIVLLWWPSTHKVWMLYVHWFGLQPLLFFCRDSRGSTWHVPLITLRLILSSFRLSSASNCVFVIPISQAVRVPVPKMLKQTDIHARSSFVFVTHHYRPNDKSLWCSIGAFITRGRHRFMHCLGVQIVDTYDHLSLFFKWKWKEWKGCKIVCTCNVLAICVSGIINAPLHIFGTSSLPGIERRMPCHLSMMRSSEKPCSVTSRRQIREWDDLSMALLVTITHFWNQLTVSYKTPYAMSLNHEMILKHTVPSEITQADPELR